MARSAPCPLGQGPGSGVSRLPDSAEVNFVVVRNTPLIPAAARFMTSCPVAADSPLKKGARQNKRVWGGGGQIQDHTAKRCQDWLCPASVEEPRVLLTQ